MKIFLWVVVTLGVLSIIGQIGGSKEPVAGCAIGMALSLSIAAGFSLFRRRSRFSKPIQAPTSEFAVATESKEEPLVPIPSAINPSNSGVENPRRILIAREWLGFLVGVGIPLILFPPIFSSWLRLTYGEIYEAIFFVYGIDDAFKSWALVFGPYALFQLFRSVRWAVRTLQNH